MIISLNPMEPDEAPESMASAPPAKEKTIPKTSPTAQYILTISRAVDMNNVMIQSMSMERLKTK